MAEIFKKREEDEQQLQKRAEKVSALALITPVKKDMESGYSESQKNAAKLLTEGYLAFEKYLKGTETKKLLTGEA